MIVAGVGFRNGVEAGEIMAIVRRAQREAGCEARGLAAPAFKVRHAGLLEAAAALNLPLFFVERSRLEAVQVRCLTRSVHAANAVGLSSVAEACALAPLDDQAKLIQPRIANAGATCALALGEIR